MPSRAKSPSTNPRSVERLFKPQRLLHKGVLAEVDPLVELPTDSVVRAMFGEVTKQDTRHIDDRGRIKLSAKVMQEGLTASSADHAYPTHTAHTAVVAGLSKMVAIPSHTIGAFRDKLCSALMQTGMQFSDEELALRTFPLGTLDTQGRLQLPADLYDRWHVGFGIGDEIHVLRHAEGALQIIGELRARLTRNGLLIDPRVQSLIRDQYARTHAEKLPDTAGTPPTRSTRRKR